MESTIVSFGRHWNSIQRSLFPCLEDEIGELDDRQKAFVGICELLIDDRMFSRYRWSGNGRPPYRKQSTRETAQSPSTLNRRPTKSPTPFQRTEHGQRMDSES